jgi:hypothetical protein
MRATRGRPSVKSLPPGGFGSATPGPEGKTVLLAPSRRKV